jgi:hypothetical protein
MSSQFLSLEEAAKKLGVSTEQLVSFRSEGRVRGFRDGASWKFPEGEIERLADDLAAEGDSYDPYQMVDEDAPAESPSSGGSGVVLDDLDLDLVSGTAGGSSLIGSDVNLIAGNGNGDGSDVKVVSAASDDDSDFTLKDRREGLVEIDSGELQLSPDVPVITHDSEMIDLAIDAKSGSTGPIAKRDIDEATAKSSGDSGLSFNVDDEDSDDDLLGLSDDVLGSGLTGGSSVKGGSALSSLELMDDLDISTGSSKGGSGLGGGLGSNDVLSELDLLSADAGGSGLISGDSGNVIGSGNALGSDKGRGPGSSGKGKGSSLILDDDDDDLLITDNDDELVLGGSDLSISGDSGINLMSPSDSGISLESEPLDLAGSSISALDLGLEVGAGGSSGKGLGSASGVGAEDFQLSPSGISIDTDSDSSSQVIEVEDSTAFAGDGLGAGDFGDALDADEAFAESGEEGGFAEEEAMAVEDGFAEEEPAARRGAPVAAYEVPYSVFQVIGLVCVVLVMGISGMLMSDLVRNIWTYAEPAAPVSGLTDMLIEISPFDK